MGPRSITDRVNAQIPSESEEITEALIAARNDVRTLLDENATLRGHIDTARMIVQQMKQDVTEEQLEATEIAIFSSDSTFLFFISIINETFICFITNIQLPSGTREAMNPGPDWSL